MACMGHALFYIIKTVDSVFLEKLLLFNTALSLFSLNYITFKPMYWLQDYSEF